jgi:hypothetical protein
MATTVFAAYNGFLTAVQAAVTAGTVVYDGPQPTVPTAFDYVVVGCDDVLAQGPTLAVDNGQRAWIGIMANAGRHADETFDIYTTVVSSTGSNNLPDCRSRAAANHAAIEAAVRSDLTLGGALTGPGWVVGLAVVRVQQITTAGAAVHMLLQLACRARV